MYYKTADLCDENQNKKIQVLSPEFKNYGGLKGFYGQIITIKLNYSTFAHKTELFLSESTYNCNNLK